MAINMISQRSAQPNRRHADGVDDSIILQECAVTKWKNMIKEKMKMVYSSYTVLAKGTAQTDPFPCAQSKSKAPRKEPSLSLERQ